MRRKSEKALQLTRLYRMRWNTRPWPTILNRRLKFRIHALIDPLSPITSRIVIQIMCVCIERVIWMFIYTNTIAAKTYTGIWRILAVSFVCFIMHHLQSGNQFMRCWFAGFLYFASALFFDSAFFLCVEINAWHQIMKLFK